MDHTISELLDIDELHSLCELYSRLTGLATAILDMEGNVLTASGWQEICTRFHRRTPEMLARCRESEQQLAGCAHQGERYMLRRCENGLYDLAVPLVIDDRQVGSLFVGQFLLESPDPELFRRQAARYGFDEASYLDALARVPVVARERVQLMMEFLLLLARMIGGMGLANRNARRARLVVENSPVVLFRWGATEGRPVKFVSENVVQFGYTPGEFFSGAITFETLVHPDDLARVREEIHAASTGGVAGFQQEYRIVTRDGRVRWVDDRTSVERDHEGRIIFRQGVMIDITQRKEAELALQFTQFAVDHARDPAYWSGPDGRFLYVNEASCRALGYTRRELLTMSVSDIRPEYPPERWPSHWREVRERKTFSFETLHRRRDGSVFPVEITVNYVLFGGKEYNCAFARDITERKGMERQLRLIQFAFDHNFDACFWINGQGAITAVNDAACRTLGYTREELLTMTVADIDPDWQGDERVLAEKHIELKNRGTPILESRHRRKDGTTFPVEICNNFLESGGEWYNCAFARDITERKRMEEELVKAQKLESVGLLAGGIAHDFNNILTAILGNASLAQALVPSGEKLREHLDSIETAAYRAKDLTQQFLTFSKGGAPIRKPVSAAEMVRTYTRLTLSGLKSTCELSIPDDVRIVDVDEGQISQVINNLMINADQAMPRGGVIRVVCENVEMAADNHCSLKEGSYVRISVSDQGVGIPAEHLGKIFDPYFTTKKEGRGLGLASAYAIMRKHAGQITVDSRPGAGATFTLYLPASTASAAAAVAEAAMAVTGNGRILVMDDEPLVSMVAGEMLEHLGYDVEFARDGEETLVMYGAARELGVPFDAVIMDLTIPGGMGGREAIARLRELDPNVRAIVSSGYSNDPVMAQYTSYGFSGVMVKPYDLGDLADQLDRVLRGGGKG